MGDEKPLDQQYDRHFTELLKQARVAARLTQEELAERAGVSARCVRDIERGRVRHPRPKTARLLGAALGRTGAALEAFVGRARAEYWNARSPSAPDPEPGPDPEHGPEPGPEHGPEPGPEPGPEVIIARCTRCTRCTRCAGSPLTLTIVAARTTIGRSLWLLSCHPGPDITAPVAASLAGLTVERVRPLLAELAEARLGRHYRAVRHYRRALLLFVAAGDQMGVARTHHNLGRMTGDRVGAANTWDALGSAHYRLGRYHRVAECLHRALAFYREAGDRYHQADTLAHLADTYRAAGNGEGARRAWHRAVDILDQLRYPDATMPRVRLAVPCAKPR